MYFLIYVACGLYLWLLGIAVFGGCETRRSLFHAPWLGYAVLIACLQILHLFSALDATASWIFLAASSLCAALMVGIRLRRGLWQGGGARRLPLVFQLTLLLGVGLLFFFPAFHTTTQAIVHYDVGYYYLQTIRWTTAFPIVTGLGNLFLNLAFNQSPFLVASLFDSLGPHLWGYSLLGGVLPWMGLSLAVFALIQGLCALLALRGPLEPIEKAYLISSAGLDLHVAHRQHLEQLARYSRRPVFRSIFFSALQVSSLPKIQRPFATCLPSTVILAALSLSVKLNAVFLVTTICALALAVLVFRCGTKVLISRPMLWAILMAAAIFLPWVWRGIVISGYPFFPSTALGAPVSWRVPQGLVSHFYDITVYWGRQPYYDLEKVRSGFAWVPDWLQRNWKLKDQFERPFILAAVWTSLLAILAWRRRNLGTTLIHLFLLLTPVAVSLVMWFFTAPDPRYLGSITWLLPLAVPLCLISDASPLANALIGVSLCVNYAALGNLRYNTEWAWKRRAPGFPEIHQIETRDDDNPYGIHLYYPKKGDQPFDAPLPSTREMQPSLRLLDETKGISGGFRDARVDEPGGEADGR